ncbi:MULTISPECIES: hypothetical protein [Metabacillus]|uniref:hypothetical protein n=1 Tax=Metabacillus TaxID=2675233 RepID=UPI001B9BB93B|nr:MULTISPECIES: hypothetical protein [Metabacillus]MCM3164720.1 hypothetical protein [Metabacillus litoralis]UGB33599.1 hypothetical protein LPC09_27075 [Metabacillus sp. B2-18]
MMKKGIHTYSWSLTDLLKEGLTPFNIVASKDGRLYEIRKSEFGTMSVPVQSLQRLEEVPTGFQMDLPKIPGYLLERVVTFFRDYCLEFDYEVMVQFFWNKELESYEVRCPIQSVSKVEVSFTESIYSEDLVEVLQIHSHNSMPAYFSPTDNYDEKRFFIYGVIGNLHTHKPSKVLRVGFNGFYYELEYDQIFTDFDITRYREYPLEWKDNVSFTSQINGKEER